MVVGASDEQKQRHVGTVTTNANDHGRPFPLARLYGFASSKLRGVGDAHEGHMTPCLVEVVYIAVENAEHTARVGRQADSAAQKIRILANSPLAVVGARRARAQLPSPMNEAVGPLCPNTTCASRREDAVRHHLHIFERRRKSSRVQVQYVLNYCCLFENLSSRPNFRHWSRVTRFPAKSGFGCIT